jgi:competence protein ComEC
MLNIPLFSSKKELFFALGVVCVIALLSLGNEFYRYQTFTQTSLHVSKATVLNHYQKTNEKGKTYDVVKLRLDSGEQFYTVSWKPLHVSLKSRIKVKFELKNLSFYEYLKGFFAPSLALYEIYEDDPPFDARPLYDFVKNQHEDAIMGELYSALLFATPLSKELREDVQKWGITHLVAISGYNVGAISFLLFFFLKPLYTFFQSRYFPYRNASSDLMPIVFLVLISYMVLIDYVPPFMRAVVMSMVGFFFFSRGIKLLSFETLAIVILGLLAFIPSLFFSLSFWFSVAGVFYLFLFVHHVKWKNKIVLFLGLDVFVFTTMLPVVHAFFPVFTFLQLSSPLWSLFFIIFYPLGLFLHLIGQGGMLDSLILGFLHVETQSYALSVPYWFLVPYGLVSLLSVWSRKLFVFTFFLALSVFFFIQ